MSNRSLASPHWMGGRAVWFQQKPPGPKASCKKPLDNPYRCLATRSFSDLCAALSQAFCSKLLPCRRSTFPPRSSMSRSSASWVAVEPEPFPSVRSLGGVKLGSVGLCPSQCSSGNREEVRRQKHVAKSESGCRRRPFRGTTRLISSTRLMTRESWFFSRSAPAARKPSLHYLSGLVEMLFLKSASPRSLIRTTQRLLVPGKRIDM